MKRSNLFLIIVLLTLACLLSMPLLVFANSDPTIINHNDEIMKLKRQIVAEHYLNVLLELLNRDDSSFKKQLDEITGNIGSYDFKKFKLSDEYEFFRLFTFPVKSKLVANGQIRILYLEKDIAEKLKNLKFERSDDVFKTGFVEKRWIKIIYYDDKPVGHIVIGWDESYNCYGVTISVLGEKGLGEAIVYMKDFLKKGGKNLNVKIIDVHERSLYVVSEDGNWWCTDAADSSNPQMYSKKIWSFEEIKDGLNNRPKEILNYFDEIQKDPEHIQLGGSPYKPLYETVTEKKEKIKNVLVATLLLLITAIFVTGVNLFSKYKKGVSIQ